MDTMGNTHKYNDGRMNQHLDTTMAHARHPSMNHMHGGSMPGRDHSMMEGMHGMSNMEHMHMQTTFSLKTYSDFLIEGVKISTVQGIILAMIFTIVISILFDSLKFMMHVRESQRANRPKAQERDRQMYWGQFVTTVYHTLSVTLAYIMMLSAMTMNVWLMISVVVGSGIGHLVMRPLLSKRLEGQLEHSPEYKSNQTADEEMKPLSGHRSATENTNVLDECNKDLLTKTNPL